MSTDQLTVAIIPSESTPSVSLSSGGMVQRLRRPLAFMLDFFFFTWVAVTAKWLLALTPLMQWAAIFQNVPVELPVAILLLSRDWLFGGRGLGKSLLRIRVVDARSGLAPSLLQSIKRNLVLLAPLLICYAAASIGALSALKLCGQSFLLLLTVATTVYAVIFFGIESYYVLSGGKGERLADRLAGTSTLWTQA